MAKSEQVVAEIFNLLRDKGLPIGEASDVVCRRVEVFLEDVEQGRVSPPPAASAPTGELKRWAESLSESQRTSGEPVTTAAIVACATIAFIAGQSNNPRFFQETIESTGSASRNILDSNAGKELVVLFGKWLSIGKGMPN